MKKTLSVQDFNDTPMILTGHGYCYRTMFESDLSIFRISPKIVLETGSIHVIKQTVLSGLGLAILPELAVQNELEIGSLVKLSYSTN